MMYFNTMDVNVVFDTVIKTVALSSLHKVYTDFCPDNYGVDSFTAMKNEPLSFQIAYKLSSPKSHKCPFYIRIESEIPVNIYSVGYVPVLHAEKLQDDGHRGPGLYPDMLLPKKADAIIDHERDFWCSFQFERDEKNNLTAFNDCWQSIWFTVNECGKNIKAGKYTIILKLYSRIGNKFIGEESVNIEIIDARLPKQKLINTNWFHCDCLADIYNVELFSDRFFEIYEDFVSTGVKNGMNMIFLPAFTPPLDTSIGKERMTVQLVGVTVDKGKYSFDFSLLKRYVDISRKAGIEYFEHAHLFTQWGATSAPKIVASVNGKEKRIFGWDTDATDKKYIDFLEAYIVAFSDFLKKEKLEKKILFHISDEPTPENSTGYINAKKELGNLLENYMCGDALSDYSFYESGMVPIPIVSITKVESFYGKCDNLWCYYTGSSRKKKMSNRLIINSSENNRIIGTQLYYYGIKGFLHWGYNYYYDMLSHGLFDPRTKTDGYYGRPGASYLVYPDNDGTAIQSVRQKVFYEGINDMRALELLEKLCGKDAVNSIISKHFGNLTFSTLPENPEQVLCFRKEVNELIANAIRD